MLKKYSLLIFVLLLSTLTMHVEADSFSFSESDSGHLKPNNEYYYFYIYQYSSTYNGEVRSESHSFSFSGALSGEEDAELLGLSDNWLIYEGKKYFIAVPACSGERIYIKNKASLDAPVSTKSKSWQPISKPVK